MSYRGLALCSGRTVNFIEDSSVDSGTVSCGAQWGSGTGREKEANATCLEPRMERDAPCGPVQLPSRLVLSFPCRRIPALTRPVPFVFILCLCLRCLRRRAHAVWGETWP